MTTAKPREVVGYIRSPFGREPRVGLSGCVLGPSWSWFCDELPVDLCSTIVQPDRLPPMALVSSTDEQLGVPATRTQHITVLCRDGLGVHASTQLCDTRTPDAHHDDTNQTGKEEMHGGSSLYYWLRDQAIVRIRRGVLPPPPAGVREVLANPPKRMLPTGV